jgi:hypothetical protein
MDKNFLLFLGNLLTNAARGQEQLDTMVKWMQQGFKGSDELTALFQKSYQLDLMSESQAAYFKIWEKATSDFQKSFADFFALFGVVPRSQHTDLLTKYEELKAKAASMEETIGHLRALLGQRHLHQEELHQGYQELVERQTADFQKLMKGMTGFFNVEAAKPEKSPEKKRAASSTRKKEGVTTPSSKRTRKS